MTDVMTAKASSNYTEEVIERMISEYEADPVRATVDRLAVELNKPVRSVIAKLSALGVYQKPAPVTKRGEPVVKKEVFVQAIEEALGISIPSLNKVTKGDLQVLVSAIQQASAE